MRGIDVDVIYEKDSFLNAWARAMAHVKMNGKKIRFGGRIKGKDQVEIKTALDVDLTIVLEQNALKEAIEGKLHPEFPTKELVKQAYLKEWERGYDWRAQGFTYCYEDRAEAYQGYKVVKINLQHFSFQPDQVPSIETENIHPIKIDQWRLAREDLAQQIESGVQSNRNVIVIGNPSIDRFEIPDSPPCLREIWIRHEGNRKVSVKWKFRSRDLGSAWMTNVIGLLYAIRREITEPNGCEIVQVVDRNDSLHVYKGDWGLFDRAKMLSVKAW